MNRHQPLTSGGWRSNQACHPTNQLPAVVSGHNIEFDVDTSHTPTRQLYPGLGKMAQRDVSPSPGRA